MPFTRPKAAQIDFDVTNITDPLIRLNSGESGSADKDAGLVIERGSDTNAAIIYDESADQFAVINTTETGTTAGNVTIASYADLKVNAIYGDGSNLTNIPTPTSATSLAGTDTNALLTLTTTEDSSSAGPVVEFKRNSSSPADADYLGQLKFKGENDADQAVVYAKITGKILDASDGTEDGIIEFANVKAGSNTITARLRSDSFQLLNSTGFSVAGTTTLTGDVTTGANIELGHASDTTIARSSAGVVTIEGNTILTTGNSDAPSTSTDSGDADFVLIDDGGTMKKITPNNLGIGSGSGGGASGFQSSTFTTAPASEGNFDLAKQQNQTGSAETPFTAGAQDAFGVSLGEVYTMMEPIGSTSSVDLGAFS